MSIVSSPPPPLPSTFIKWIYIYYDVGDKQQLTEQIVLFISSGDNQNVYTHFTFHMRAMHEMPSLYYPTSNLWNSKQDPEEVFFMNEPKNNKKFSFIPEIRAEILCI